MRDREIRFRPHHVPVGEGVVHEEYVVTCDCGYYEKTGDAPTHAGRKRAGLLLAMTHNTQRHSYGYKIKETS